MRLYIPVERPKNALAIYILCLVPFAILAAHQWNYLPRLTDGDFAQYILHAKALVDGRRYTDTGYIYTPFTFLVGPRAQPPGLPLLLTPVVALFGTNLMVLKNVVVLSAVAFVLIAATYFGRRESLWTGAAVALLTSLSLQTQNATISVIADLPFAAACWWLISLADREGPWTGYRAALVTVLGGVAVAFRVAGAAAGLAVILFALLRPPAQKRAASLPLVLWLIGGLAAVTFFGEFIPFWKQILQLPKADFVHRAFDFVRQAKEAVLYALMYPFGGDRSNDLYHALALIPMAIGGVHFLVRYRRTFAWCFLLA
ncbi:MAG: glycosyltransferase family 39 protein, partial [Gemmatimonadaceae bacterium]